MATYKTRKLLLHVTCRNCKNNFGERYYFRPDLKNFPRKRWLLEVVWRSKFCLASLDAALRWLAHLHSLGLGNFVEHWFVEMVSLQAKSKMSKMTLHDYSEPLCTSQIEASTFPLPPFWAHPSNLIPFPAREGGHLITTHRGWGIFITSLDVMLRVGLIPYGFINHGGDSRDKLCGRLDENQRPTQALFHIWRCLRTIYIYLWII